VPPADPATRARSAISRLDRSAAHHLADSTIIRAEIEKMLASP
jgi:hypothetical protein